MVSILYELDKGKTKKVTFFAQLPILLLLLGAFLDIFSRLFPLKMENGMDWPSIKKKKTKQEEEEFGMKLNKIIILKKGQGDQL